MRNNSKTFFRSNSFVSREGKGEGRGGSRRSDREAAILTTAPDTTNESVPQLQRPISSIEVTARLGGLPPPEPEARPINFARNDDDRHVSVTAEAPAGTTRTALRARLKRYSRSLSFSRNTSMAGDSSSSCACDTIDESKPATVLAMPCLAEGAGGSRIGACPSDVFGNDAFNDDDFKNLPVATAVSSRKHSRVFSRSKSAGVPGERLPADRASGTLRHGGSLSATFQITGRNHLAMPGRLVVYVTL